MIQQPDGIILTISNGMLKENGYRHWLKNFLGAMEREDCTYCFRTGNIPKKEILYVYFCIGGKIRWRCLYVQGYKACRLKFEDGREMFAKAWIVCCGPPVKAPFEIPMKGFRGYRYTQKLF